jgi:predicted enzyme related to lactoylglutathione lyase
MTSHLSFSAITIDTPDPHRAANFWITALGGTLRSSADDVFLDPLGGAPRLHFQRSDGDTCAARPIHLDFRVEWNERAAHVSRLVEAGGTAVWDVLDKHPGLRWTKMADPDGNLFCVSEVESP